MDGWGWMGRRMEGGWGDEWGRHHAEFPKIKIRGILGWEGFYMSARLGGRSRITVKNSVFSTVFTIMIAISVKACYT